MGTEQLVEKSPTFVVDAGVLRSEEGQQIALSLVGHHLDQVRQVLALRGELDYGTLTDFTDFDPLGKLAASSEEFLEAQPCGAEFCPSQCCDD